MTIFRGPGGTGSASSEVDTTEYQEFLVQAQAAKVAAEAARDAALAAETNAELAETNAEAAEASAIASGNAAQDWATKTSGPVAGGEYSAKYNAQLAAASAAASEAALDAYEDRYLGAKTSDPTVDNDGNALVAGTQYFNTVSDEIKVYNGTSWQSAAVVGGTVTDLTVTNTIVGSITGNAGTVTNGVVTTGSYANPSWLTSLAWSKVTSTPTTIAGYGITNAYTKTEVDTADALKLNAANPSYTGTLTGGTGVVNLGSGQFYKDASGNVGIGTSSPSRKLEVSSNDAQTDLMVSRTSNGLGAILRWDNTAGAAHLYTNGAYPLLFGTNNTERARIDTSGNLLVGYTSSNGSYKLQVNSQIFATSSTIATSDARYKKDVSNISGALALVSSLRPVQFSWKEHPVHNFNTDTPTIGFLAQEVKEVFKDTAYVGSIVKVNETTLPDKTKEEFLGIAEGNLIAVLTAAIQEQQAIISAQQAALTALTARVEALEAA